MHELLNKLIGKVNASVKTTAQTLTDAQKAQARTNVGAASQQEVSRLSEEIAALGTQEDIVQQVIAALGTPVFGTVGENKHIALSGHLANGTYTITFEDSDGFVSDVCTIEKGGYTNLADPSSAEWLTNKRINSSGNVVDVTEAQRGDKTVVTINLIDLQGVSVLYVKGLDIMSNLVNGSSTQNYGRFHIYNSNKEMIVNTVQPSKYSYVTVSGPDVWAIDIPGFLSQWGYSDERYCRLAGILTGAAEDVIVTADEPIE